MSNTIKIGFVGVGAMGQCAHLKHYATIPDCEVVAISEPRPQLLAAVARKYNIPRTYATGEEMVANEQLDGIVASQMFDKHYTIVAPFLRRGIPVFTEKPLAASLEAGEKLLAAVAEGGSWHMIGYQKRSDLATVYAKTEIDRLKQTGELGKLRYVRLTMPEGDWIAGGFDDLIKTDESIPPSARDVEEVWGRPLINYYIHQINMLRYLLGESYRVVFADKARQLFVAESASGVTGIIELTPYMTTVDWQESALVGFDHGYIRIDYPAPLAANRPGQVEIFRDPSKDQPPQTIRPQFPWVSAMRQQAINFVRAIKGEIKPPVESSEALEDLRVVNQYLELVNQPQTR